MNESNSPSQERDGQPDAQQTDSAVESTDAESVDTDANPTDTAAGPVDTAAGSVDTAAGPVDTDTEPEDQIDAALAEADAALTRAAESHDDYREAITDATVALDEVDRLRGQSVPGAAANLDSDRVDSADLDAAAAPAHTDGTGHLELSHAGQVLVRAARTLKRARQFPAEAAAGLVQTTARASIHLCHEEVPDDALADVATEAIEGVGHLAAMSRDSDATDEQVAAAATELFEILSKVEEVRAASDARTDTER